MQEKYPVKKDVPFFSTENMPTITAIFDIDLSIATALDVDQELWWMDECSDEYFQIIDGGRPLVTHPGLIAFIRLLDKNKIIMACFSAGHEVRNNLFFMNLLICSLGEKRYQEIKDTVIIRSRNHLEEGNVHKRKRGHPTKNLELIVEKEQLNWTFFIEDNVDYVKRGQEKNLIAVSECDVEILEEYGEDAITRLNHIYYVVGLLSVALELTKNNKELTLTDALHQLQYSKKGYNSEPLYDINSIYYEKGLALLKTINPKSCIITPLWFKSKTDTFIYSNSKTYDIISELQTYDSQRKRELVIKRWGAVRNINIMCTMLDMFDKENRLELVMICKSVIRSDYDCSMVISKLSQPDGLILVEHLYFVQKLMTLPFCKQFLKNKHHTTNAYRVEMAYQLLQSMFVLQIPACKSIHVICHLVSKFSVEDGFLLVMAYEGVPATVPDLILLMRQFPEKEARALAWHFRALINSEQDLIDVFNVLPDKNDPNIIRHFFPQGISLFTLLTWKLFDHRRSQFEVSDWIDIMNMMLKKVRVRHSKGRLHLNLSLSAFFYHPENGKITLSDHIQAPVLETMDGVLFSILYKGLNGGIKGTNRMLDELFFDIGNNMVLATEALDIIELVDSIVLLLQSVYAETTATTDIFCGNFRDVVNHLMKQHMSALYPHLITENDSKQDISLTHCDLKNLSIPEAIQTYLIQLPERFLDLEKKKLVLFHFSSNKPCQSKSKNKSIHEERILFFKPENNDKSSVVCNTLNQYM